MLLLQIFMLFSCFPHLFFGLELARLSLFYEQLEGFNLRLKAPVLSFLKLNVILELLNDYRARDFGSLMRLQTYSAVVEVETLIEVRTIRHRRELRCKKPL